MKSDNVNKVKNIELEKRSKIKLIKEMWNQEENESTFRDYLSSSDSNEEVELEEEKIEELWVIKRLNDCSESESIVANGLRNFAMYKTLMRISISMRRKNDALCSLFFKSFKMCSNENQRRNVLLSLFYGSSVRTTFHRYSRSVRGLIRKEAVLLHQLLPTFLLPARLLSYAFVKIKYDAFVHSDAYNFSLNKIYQQISIKCMRNLFNQQIFYAFLCLKKWSFNVLTTKKTSFLEDNSSKTFCAKIYIENQDSFKKAILIICKLIEKRILLVYSEFIENIVLFSKTQAANNHFFMSNITAHALYLLKEQNNLFLNIRDEPINTKEIKINSNICNLFSFEEKNTRIIGYLCTFLRRILRREKKNKLETILIWRRQCNLAESILYKQIEVLENVKKGLILSL